MKNYSVIFLLFSIFFLQTGNRAFGQEMADTLSPEVQIFVADTAPTIILSDEILYADSLPLPLVAFKPDPVKATWYALVCPGLGQIYNRSYWKVPIVYGGIATLSYLITWNGRMYNDYRNAYQDIMDNDPNTNSFEPFFYGMESSDLSWKQSTLQRKRDYYRRYRDLSIFGMVLLYVVSVVDSFVDAHLYDFSVTEDLSLRVEPVIRNPVYLNDSPSNPTMMGFQCTINF